MLSNALLWWGLSALASRNLQLFPDLCEQRELARLLLSVCSSLGHTNFHPTPPAQISPKGSRERSADFRGAVAVQLPPLLLPANSTHRNLPELWRLSPQFSDTGGLRLPRPHCRLGTPSVSKMEQSPLLICFPSLGNSQFCASWCQMSENICFTYLNAFSLVYMAEGNSHSTYSFRGGTENLYPSCFHLGLNFKISFH